MKQLTEVPTTIGGGAFYPDKAELGLEKKFTRVDRFGEPYKMYTRDITRRGILVPRNFAPKLDTTKIEEVLRLSMGPRVYSWDDGFIPRNSEQSRLVDESEAILRAEGYRGGHIIQASTGFGKTYVGASIIQRMCVRACVITTKEDTLDDWVTALVKTLNIDPESVGIWRGNQIPTDKHQVVVGLIQSVCKGLERYDELVYGSFGLVMVDEVHRMGADKFSQAMWHFPAHYRVGLSATPYRKDGKEVVFEGHIGPVRVSTEMETLIPKVIMFDTQWKVPTVWNYDADLNKSMRGPLVIPWGRMMVAVKHLKRDKRRNDTIVNFLKSAIKQGRNTVVFSDTIEHLEILHAACVKAGIPDDQDTMGFYCGLQAIVYLGYLGTPKEAREKAKNARIAFATFKFASEATDVPWWDTCVLTTPKADVVQPVGRIRREYENKKIPLVLDMCDWNHKVTATFAKARLKWYKSIGAEIKYM